MIIKCNKCGYNIATEIDHRGATCFRMVGDINPQPCFGHYHEVIPVVPGVPEITRNYIGAMRKEEPKTAVVMVDRDEVIQRLIDQVDKLTEELKILKQRLGFAGADNFVAHHSTPPEPPKPQTLADYCKHVIPVMPYWMRDDNGKYQVCSECHKRVMPGKDD